MSGMRKEEALDVLMRLYMERKGADQGFVNRELVPLGKQEIQRLVNAGQFGRVAQIADAMAVVMGQVETVDEELLEEGDRTVVR